MSIAQIVIVIVIAVYILQFWVSWKMQSIVLIDIMYRMN